MELIRPSVEIWEQGTTLEDMWKHIAKCTRVCYQSTPKKNGEPDEEFVKRVILHNGNKKDFEKLHCSMLEHGTVYLKFEMDYEGIERCDKYYHTMPYSECCDDHKFYYITTNLRVIYEHGWLDDLKYLCAPTEHHVKRVTVSFITNIGVTREFNRHRVNSIAEESTRYCNYTKEKFGNEITYACPAWINEHTQSVLNDDNSQDVLDFLCKEYGTEDEHTWNDIDYYSLSLYMASYCYNNLIRLGWTPQMAREVLPLATKSQLVHTAFVSDWEHFFKLRTIGVSGAPHPNARLVAKPLYNEFVKRGYINEL